MFDQINKKSLWVCAGIFFLALLVRFIYLYQSSANPSFNCPIIDSETYDDIARMLASGKGMSDKFFWQSFFYPFFLSIVYYLGSPSILLAKIVQAILGSFTCVLTYQLGKKIFSPKIGIAAGIITCVYGPLIFYDGELVAAGWAAFWAVVLILLLIKCASKVSVGLYALLGLCGGLAIMTRPTFVPFLATALVWLIIKIRRAAIPWRKIIPCSAIMLAGLLLILIPVAFLNFRTTDHFKVMPSSGGINLYLGNNPNYIKTITARPGWDWEKINALPEQNGITGDLVAQEKYFKKEVLNYVFNQPLDFAAGLVYKTREFLNSREIPRNLNIYLFSQWSKLLGALTFKVGGFGVPFGILLPFTLIGVVSYRKAIPGAVVLFLILFPASVILVFVAGRYRVPMVPVMAVIAAAGGAKLIETIRQRKWRQVLLICLLTIEMFWLSSMPAKFAEEKINYKAELYRNVAAVEKKQGRTDKALQYLDKALQVGCDDALANFDMANLLAEMGKTEPAIKYYDLSLEADPRQAKTHNNLANALVKMNAPAKAIYHYRIATRLEPKHVMMRNNLAKTLAANGQIDEAIDEYRLALQIDSNATVHNNLGLALLSQNKFDLAERHFNEAKKLEPENAQAINNLGVTYYKEKKFDLAEKELLYAAAIDPNLIEAHYYLGCIYYQQNNLKAAVSHWEQTVKLKPDLTEIHNNLSLIFAADKSSEVFNMAKAIEHAEKALELAVSSGQNQLAEKIKAQLQLYKAK